MIHVVLFLHTPFGAAAVAGASLPRPGVRVG